MARAVHLELLPDQKTKEFLKVLKRVTARKGTPTTIYSDNAISFIATSKWIKSIKRSEEINDFLNKKSGKWEFILSCIPWWDGQYERMVDIIKNLLYKIIVASNPTGSELEEILIDVEVTISNLPFCYVEDNIQLLIFTSNIMILGKATSISEKDPDNMIASDLRKMQKYIIRCKEAI